MSDPSSPAPAGAQSPDPFASIYPSMKAAPEPATAPVDSGLARLYPSMARPDAPAAAPAPSTVPAAAGEAPAAIPEAYRDLALPEGYQLDEATFAGVANDFQKAGVTRQQAEALLGTHARLEQQRVARIDREIAAQDRAWAAENARSMQPGDRAAIQAVMRDAPAEVRKLLADLGIGSHPGMVKWIVALGRKLGGGQPADPWTSIYPSMRPRG